MGRSLVCVCIYLLQVTLAVKVKVVMRSDEDSKIEDDETRTEPWSHKKRLEPTILPFIKHHKKREPHVEEKIVEYEEYKATTEKARQLHPNDMIFPLIYRQSHINSMFKFGENWYTWSIEKRTDGSKAISYYICYDEPKRCDDVGWDRTDALPKCAFQIESVMADDRACVNSFGVEPRVGGVCDGAEQMKVSEIVHACGPRIRTLWRFLRVGRRPANSAKPADVNSLLCEDEEECYLSLEYRVHHDRITFSLHEPMRGQTFKSMLKREFTEEPVTPTTEVHVHNRRNKKIIREDDPMQKKKIHFRLKNKPAEGKGILKEKNDSGYTTNRRILKNKIKIREDISEDASSE